MNTIPLVKGNTQEEINTSLIALKKALDEMNSSSSKTDASVQSQIKQINELIENINTQIEDLQPVNSVTSGNMQSVTSNAVSRAMSYSTSEVNTGKKWINGKTIYSKTYYNVSNFPHSAGLTNVDEITKIDAVAIDVGSNFYPLPFVTVVNGVTYYANIYYNKNNNAIYSDSNSNIEGVNVTLEYTKTTD